MGAKTTFQDIVNNELEAPKLNFNSFNLVLSAAAGLPAAGTASVGALYVDTNSGNLYRKGDTGLGSTSWVQISSVTSTVFQNHYRQIHIAGVSVTATDTGAPAYGDLVGLYGAGAWTLLGAGGNLIISKSSMGFGGAQNASWIAGGSNVAGNVISNTDLFNGSSWSTSANLNVSKNFLASAGSQNSALIAGGRNGAGNAISNTDLFNGSSWSTSTNINVSKYRAVGAGVQSAFLIAGGLNAANGVLSNTDLFNGSSWSTSANLNVSRWTPSNTGSQNATLITGGGLSTALGSGTTNTEIFNGSAWSTSGYLTIARYALSGAGSQNASLITAGLDINGASISNCELFNGSVWSNSGNMNISRSYLACAGSQNSALIAGGSIVDAQNSTELHTQTTYRKIYSREYNNAKSIGILINVGVFSLVKQQGTISQVVYVPNKWLIVNRYMNSMSSGDANLSSVQLTSIQGSAPTPTYNFSSTVLSLVPGMMAIVTSSGGTPGPAADYGTFLITRAINPASIELTNASAVAQNPATGTISFISTMLAVDQISPGDIVIGRTDDSGYLTIHKPITIGSLNRRLA